MAVTGGDDVDWVTAFSQVTRRTRGRTRAVVLVERLLAGCILLGLWQALESFGVFSAFLISSPWLVADDLFHWVQQGELYSDLWITAAEMLSGLAIGTGLGVVVGIFVGLRPRLTKAVQPLVVAIYAVPIVILVPLAVLWFGFGEAPRIIIVTVSVFFVMFFNTVAGVQDVDRALIANLEILGHGRLSIARSVYAPSVVSWVIVAMRSAVAFAFVGAVAAEFIAATSGLGVALTYAANLFQIPRMFSVLVVLAVLGGIFSALIDLAERVLLRWR